MKTFSAISRLHNSASKQMARNISRPSTRGMSTNKRNFDDDVAPGYTVDKSVGPMYRYQRSLPNLPVPLVIETAAKYLETVKPLASSEEEFINAQQSVENFVSDPIVRVLQNRLKERAAKEDNWIADWWNEAAYFGFRDPVVPGVNYFYVHKDDPYSRSGPQRAAKLIRALLYFRRLVDAQKLEPEMVRQTPLCMSSYKWLFNSCRIPEPQVDTAKKYDPEKNNHIAVLRNNRFFIVPVVDNEGNFLSAADLEMQFKRIISAAGNDADPHPLGALTSQNRDEWAAARTELLKDPANAESLEKIESAIIVVALDNETPVTRGELSWGLWVGDGQNRFFDKHQLIVYDNGRSGFNGEHSCMDGTPTSRLNDWLLRSVMQRKIDMGDSEPRENLAAPSQLHFNLSSSIKQAISKSIIDHQKIMSTHRLSVLHFEGYGKNAIKRFKTGPDSWAQLVMQLAFFKMTGKLAATYESAQTRKFKRGRTEVIRSATSEALEWCKAMEDPHRSNATRLQLFRNAASAHVKYASFATDGKGVDRHLFGLKKLLREGEPVPALYSDPLFVKSSHWTLSTSNLTSPMIPSWGFGEVVEDGYGLGYSVNDNSLRFTITSVQGNTKHLKHYISESCTQVMECMEAGVRESEAKMDV